MGGRGPFYNPFRKRLYWNIGITFTSTVGPGPDRKEIETKK
jgi:hypothetical protein